jgi:hypothetical protein
MAAAYGTLNVVVYGAEELHDVEWAGAIVAEASLHRLSGLPERGPRWSVLQLMPNLAAIARMELWDAYGVHRRAIGCAVLNPLRDCPAGVLKQLGLRVQLADVGIQTICGTQLPHVLIDASCSACLERCTIYRQHPHARQSTTAFLDYRQDEPLLRPYSGHQGLEIKHSHGRWQEPSACCLALVRSNVSRNCNCRVHPVAPIPGNKLNKFALTCEPPFCSGVAHASHVPHCVVRPDREARSE